MHLLQELTSRYSKSAEDLFDLKCVTLISVCVTSMEDGGPDYPLFHQRVCYIHGRRRASENHCNALGGSFFIRIHVTLTSRINRT